MSYTSNPNVGKVRLEAVRLVEAGWSTREVARHLGYNQSSIVRWTQRNPHDKRVKCIPTFSSRPHHHPKELGEEIVLAILAERKKSGRCAEVVHAELLRHGLVISLSSVKRTLDRHGLIQKRSPWKRYHPHEERPLADKPGVLIEVDTIHFARSDLSRFFVYTLVDVCTRWAYAQAIDRISAQRSADFLFEAQRVAPFSFVTIQSDHGPEFSTHFSKQLRLQELMHRHSRVRKPNDNAHLERFNRTLQEECLNKAAFNPDGFQAAISEYLPRYNNERLHLGLNLQTPLQVMQRY